MKTNKYGAIIGYNPQEMIKNPIQQTDDTYINNIKKQESIDTMEMMDIQDKKDPNPGGSMYKVLGLGKHWWKNS